MQRQVRHGMTNLNACQLLQGLRTIIGTGLDRFDLKVFPEICHSLIFRHFLCVCVYTQTQYLRNAKDSIDRCPIDQRFQSV